MWTGEYESNKVLADAYYIKREKKSQLSKIRGYLWIRPWSFHAVVVHGLDFKETSKKKRDVSAELLFFLINLLLLSVPIVVVS